MMYFDIRYLIIMIPCMILAGIAQMRVKGAFTKYSKIRPSSGMTGAQAAMAMLRAAGLEGRVGIERVQGFLSDHYDPRKKVLRLSPEVHDKSNLAAVGIACHEVGHAVQDAKAYAPLVMRNAIVPTANIGTNLAWVFIFLGLFISVFRPLAMIGVLLFGTVVIFQLVNLPVEFNASARAKKMLPELGIIRGREEAAGVAATLNAAAMTYVAATITALATMLYYSYLVFGRRN
jgi:Zn-dependent membrane protease YugP